jgi:hypothetical protein
MTRSTAPVERPTRSGQPQQLSPAALTRIAAAAAATGVNAAAMAPRCMPMEDGAENATGTARGNVGASSALPPPLASPLLQPEEERHHRCKGASSHSASPAGYSRATLRPLVATTAYRGVACVVVVTSVAPEGDGRCPASATAALHLTCCGLRVSEAAEAAPSPPPCIRVPARLAALDSLGLQRQLVASGRPSRDCPRGALRASSAISGWIVGHLEATLVRNVAAASHAPPTLGTEPEQPGAGIEQGLRNCRRRQPRSATGAAGCEVGRSQAVQCIIGMATRRGLTANN